MTESTLTERQLSRRRIIQGAAWAAPAIVIASAAPASASSALAISLIASGTNLAWEPGEATSVFTGVVRVYVTGAPVGQIIGYISMLTSFANTLSSFQIDSGANWTTIGSTEVSGRTIFAFSYGLDVAAGFATTKLEVSWRSTVLDQATPIQAETYAVGTPVAGGSQLQTPTVLN